MLRWSCGCTKMDRTENSKIREKTNVAEINWKIQDKRLRWNGHLHKGEEEHVALRVVALEADRKRRGGRPLRRWTDCITEDLAEKGSREWDAAEQGCWRKSPKLTTLLGVGDIKDRRRGEAFSGCIASAAKSEICTLMQLGSNGCHLVCYRFSNTLSIQARRNWGGGGNWATAPPQ